MTWPTRACSGSSIDSLERPARSFKIPKNKTRIRIERQSSVISSQSILTKDARQISAEKTGQLADEKLAHLVAVYRGGRFSGGGISRLAGGAALFSAGAGRLSGGRACSWRCSQPLNLFCSSRICAGLFSSTGGAGLTS